MNAEPDDDLAANLYLVVIVLLTIGLGCALYCGWLACTGVVCAWFST